MVVAGVWDLVGPSVWDGGGVGHADVPSGPGVERQDLINVLLAAAVSGRHTTVELRWLAVTACRAGDRASAVEVAEAMMLMAWSVEQLVGAADRLSG